MIRYLLVGTALPIRPRHLLDAITESSKTAALFYEASCFRMVGSMIKPAKSMNMGHYELLLLWVSSVMGNNNVWNIMTVNNAATIATLFMTPSINDRSSWERWLILTKQVELSTSHWKHDLWWGNCLEKRQPGKGAIYVFFEGFQITSPEAEKYGL